MCIPASPNTETIKSDAPFITLGCSIKSSVELTKPVNFIQDLIFDKSPPKVINGASDLIVSIFGNYGMHTRAAVSTNSLPLGVSVEVDAIFELN